MSRRPQATTGEAGAPRRRIRMRSAAPPTRDDADDLPEDNTINVGGVPIYTGTAPVRERVALGGAHASPLGNPMTEQDRYEIEHQLRMVHRLLMRHVPIPTIAAELGVGTSRVESLRRELFRRVREQAASMDFVLHAAESIGFFDEVRGMALRIASSNSTPVGSRIRALAVSLKAETDKHAFLQMTGFYGNAKINPVQEPDDPEAQGARTLMTMVRSIFADDGASVELDGDDFLSEGDEP